MAERIRVHMSVTSDQAEVITRAVEAMSRAAAGLALEGVEVWLTARPDDEDGPS